MSHLRGVVHLHMNAVDRAKECFLHALKLDIKCYDSFEALISGNMMDVNEGQSIPHVGSGRVVARHSLDIALLRENRLIRRYLRCARMFAEWHFIQGLAFQEHTPEDADFIRMMYTIRLKKVRLSEPRPVHAAAFKAAGVEQELMQVDSLHDRARTAKRCRSVAKL